MKLLADSLGRIPLVLGLIGIALLATPGVAYGYLDPVSGSLVLQVLSAALFAGLLSVKRVWLWLGRLFRWHNARKSEE